MPQPFIPLIQASVNFSCNTLVIEDITGVYVNGNPPPNSNAGGWDFASTLYKTFTVNYVTASSIVIKRNGINVGGPFNVLSTIQQSGLNQTYTLLNFSFTQFNGNAILWNGTYDIEWTIVNQSPSFDVQYVVTAQVIVNCSLDPANNLDPKLLVTTDACKGLLIQDNTGIFNSISNTGGWGHPTTSYKSVPPIQSAIQAPPSITIKRNGVVVAGPFNVLSSMITSDPNTGTYTLLNYYPNQLLDGTYEIVWTFGSYSNIPNEDWYVYYEVISDPIVINCRNDFSPKIEVCVENCDELVIKDVTGTYNVSTNPTGWNDSATIFKNNTLGTPYVKNAILSIKKQGTEIFGSSIDVTSVIQNSVAEEYTLLSTKDFSYNFVDGIYTIKLTITDNTDVTYVIETTKVVYCHVFNCVLGLAGKLADELCDDCENEDFETFDIASTFLNSLDALAVCDEPEFYNMINKINKFCNLSSIGGCDCDCTYN